MNDFETVRELELARDVERLRAELTEAQESIRYERDTARAEVEKLQAQVAAAIRVDEIKTEEIVRLRAENGRIMNTFQKAQAENRAEIERLTRQRDVMVAQYGNDGQEVKRLREQLAAQEAASRALGADNNALRAQREPAEPQLTGEDYMPDSVGER